MASTEVDYLKTEYSIEPIKIKHKKGTAWKAKQTKKQSDNGNTVASISTCVHHFKDTEFDVNCERCICQRRGYCLA